MSTLSVSAASCLPAATPYDQFLKFVEEGDKEALQECWKIDQWRGAIDSNALLQGVAIAIRSHQIAMVHYLYLGVTRLNPEVEVVHGALEAAAIEGNWRGLSYLLDITPLSKLQQSTIDLALARVVEAASPDLSDQRYFACRQCMKVLIDAKVSPSDEGMAHALLGAVFMDNEYSVQYLLNAKSYFSWSSLGRGLKRAVSQGNDAIITSIYQKIQDQKSILNREIKYSAHRSVKESLISEASKDGYTEVMRMVETMRAQGTI